MDNVGTYSNTREFEENIETENMKIEKNVKNGLFFVFVLDIQPEKYIFFHLKNRVGVLGDILIPFFINSNRIIILQEHLPSWVRTLPAPSDT